MQAVGKKNLRPKDTFNCEKCLSTFRTGEALKRHYADTHVSFSGHVRNIIPDRRTLIMGGLIAGGITIGALVLAYCLWRNSKV